MQSYMILGNCVAHRLQECLRHCPVLGRHWQQVPAPMIHSAELTPDALQALAHTAEQCDVVFSQPLFRYGPCNTDVLQERLKERLILFPSLNFEAYFPDVLRLPAPQKPLFPSPLEWHSRCIMEAYTAGIPSEALEAFYVQYALFSKKNVALQLAETLEKYAKREQGLHITSLEYARTWCTKRPLFHTWQHPDMGLLVHVLAKFIETFQEYGEGGLAALSSEEARHTYAQERLHGADFGFNQWPIITRQHPFFTFEERAYFVIAGRKVSLEDAGEGYYNYYALHPDVLERG